MFLNKNKKIPSLFVNLKNLKNQFKTNKFLVWGNINKIYFIMDKVFKYFNDFFKGLTGLILGLLALSILADFLFGPGSIGN